MSESATRPNVLLVATDHWPASLLGISGSAVMTPTLDQLARNGVQFTNAYTECPVCIPARRTLITGANPRTHGDRVFAERLPMPPLPTIAQTFRDAGYQAYAAGKLHVYPPRDRIGFDDVMLVEEGRLQFGAIDDYETYLAEQGYAGEQFLHGMSNNEYLFRPWHLPEQHHVTNWTTRQLTRFIQRRDPTRPGFWYLSYIHPHPPLVPLGAYLDMYRDIEPDAPVHGEWTSDPTTLPSFLQVQRHRWDDLDGSKATAARRAFYALCTHIDHQMRIVIGTLRQQGILDNTIIMFTSDHGDMLGDHGFWAKRLFYEQSANIPMLLVGTANGERIGFHRTDDRLVGLQDVMPTLLDLAGIDVPDTVDGISMVGDRRRSLFYGENGEDIEAMRMIRNDRYKLIYYAAGNHRQLFDLATDPDECHDLVANSDHLGVLTELTNALIDRLYGSDEAWLQDGTLVGLPPSPTDPTPNRGLSGQRGSHWPPPPPNDEAISLL